MSLESGTNKLCKEICDALGLKYVRELTLHMKVDSIVTVTAEYYPEEDGLLQFPSLLKEFELVEKEKTTLGEEFKTYQFTNGGNDNE